MFLEDKPYLKAMNDEGERLDVLHYHRLTVNNLLVTDCVTFPILFFFFSASKQLK